MRFLSFIRIAENDVKPPTEKLMADMGKLMEEMMREGVLVDTAGLRPTAEGVRVRLRRGEISQVDGPFTETKEVIGGYAILEAPSMEEAIRHVRRFLAVHGDEWDLDCEVRPIEAMEADCGASPGVG